MQIAGGANPLVDNFPSLEIELGADYLTGVVFRQGFPEIPLADFETSLTIRAKYREQAQAIGAHGTPGQRAAAFRYGAHKDFDELNRDFRQANDYFQSNVYNDIVWAPAAAQGKQ